MKNFFFFTGGIRINKIRILILATLILAISSCVGAATEYTVNGGSIQAAVTNAASGDIITIGPGTYKENILIDGKSNLLIRSSDGPTNTIIANNSGKHVIEISDSDKVTIQGFNVTGAGIDNAGIYVLGSTNCRVEGNILHDDALGVSLENSHYTVIRDNIATKNLLTGLGRAVSIEKSSSYNTVSNNTISNQNFGIYLLSSDWNTISENSISKSATDSITVDKSNNNIIENNTATSNSRYGIYLSDSSNNILRDNPVSSGDNGIYLVESSGNKISNSVISLCSQHNIMLDNSSDNSLTNNTVSGSTYGIAARYSNNNILIGNNAYNNSQGLYITLTSTNNTLSGNKANSNRGSGISLYRVNGNTLQSNEANSNPNNGIILDKSSNNKVLNNIVSKNARGISLTTSSSGNELSDNTVNSNTDNGIVLDNSSNNELISNTAGSNKNYGIHLTKSSNNDLTSNTASSNSKGIYLLSSSGNMISKNTVFSNTVNTVTSNGIMLSLSDNNTLYMNKAFKNPYGISLNSSKNNNISSNSVTLSTNYGLFLCPQSTDNLIFNNYLNNSQNVDSKNNQSKWNVTSTLGENIVGGTKIGGNCWADPVLKNDYSQTATDANQDGFADSTYSGDIFIDYLPLMEGYLAFPDANFNASTTSGYAPLSVVFTDLSQNATEWNWNFGDGTTSKEKNPTHIYSAAGTYNVKLIAINTYGTDYSQTAVITVTENIPPVNIQPVANFSLSTASGYAPLLVTFTDLSQNATTWKWDFGDGATSTLPSPTHTYSAAGTYNVKLTVSNGNNFASKTATITVQANIPDDDDDDGGSSHRSGGSGGGGGSPEPARNVEVKELSQKFITNGKAVKFDFTKNATCVVYVGFDAKKTVGKTTTIAEQLKNKSTLVSSLSEGEVYKYFNVWVGNSGFATSANIDNPTICFKVEKSWVQDKKIDKDSITLNRYSDKKWEQLPVSLSGEDSKYLYFTADVPGYSFFAITGKINATPEKTETEIQPDDSDNSEDMENTSSEANQESGEEENTGMPGFEIVYGVAGLLAVFLYKRK